MRLDQPSQMRWVLLCATVFARFVAAIEITRNFDSDLVAGEDVEIPWANAEGPVSIGLRKGPPDNLGRPELLASDLEGEEGIYIWTVPDDIEPGADYVFEVTDESGINNYSEQLAIIGPPGESSTATSGDDADSTTTTGGPTAPSGIILTGPISFSDGVLITDQRTLMTTTSEPPSTTSTSGSNSATFSNTAAASSGSGDSGGGSDGSSGDEGGGGGGGGGGGSDASTIGIAVGVTLGVVGLLGLAAGYWFYRRSVRNRKAAAGAAGTDEPSHSGLGAAGVGGEKKGEEIGGNPVSEMYAPNATHELAGDGGAQRPVELSADEAGGRR